MMGIGNIGVKVEEIMELGVEGKTGLRITVISSCGIFIRFFNWGECVCLYFLTLFEDTSQETPTMMEYSVE